MDIDLQSVLQTFEVESQEQLREMEEALVALENGPENDETLRSLFRAAHTIKGSAWSLGFSAVTEFAHTIEDLLENLLEKRLAVASQLITLLLRGVDALREMIPAAVMGIGEMQPSHEAVLRALVSTKAGAASVSTEQEKAADERPSGERRRASGKRKDDITGWNDRERTLRVNLDKLDTLLNLTGEISIYRGRLGNMLEKRQECTREQILEVHNEADHLYTQLQELVMKIRMVPVGPTFRQYVRTVRDVAREKGKLARLVIEGGDVEVDTKVIEYLRDPLTHLIRNALDHGIEPPEARTAKGKDPHGRLALRAYHDSGSVVIELADDGEGLDRERIVEQARCRGTIAETEQLTEQDLYRLIMEPGFSTAEVVTDLSGRGVGMDVVRRNVETLRGTVGIESQPGEGATITIRLPLTLAIIEGFGVGVCGETYVIPMDTVVECLELPEDRDSRPDEGGVLSLRGKPLPYVQLRSLFALQGTAPKRQYAVVVQHNGLRAGLAVDVLYGASQTVIKPLGKLFRGLSGISGSAILGNGQVALIIDVPSLLSKTEGLVGRVVDRHMV